MATRRRAPRTETGEARFRRDAPAQRPPAREPAHRDPAYDDPAYRDSAYADPAVAAAPGGWRDDVMSASGLNILAGIWLIIAPFVLNYSNGDPYWNDIVFGAIVALIGLARVTGAQRASELSWINAAIGVWIFISAFWLDNTARASWNDVILGIVIFVLAIASASASEAATSRWRR